MASGESASAGHLPTIRTRTRCKLRPDGPSISCPASTTIIRRFSETRPNSSNQSPAILLILFYCRLAPFLPFLSFASAVLGVQVVHLLPRRTFVHCRILHGSLPLVRHRSSQQRTNIAWRSIGGSGCFDIKLENRKSALLILQKIASFMQIS